MRIGYRDDARMKVASGQAALMGAITREELAGSMYQDRLAATRGGRRLIPVQSEVGPAITAATKHRSQLSRSDLRTV